MFIYYILQYHKIYESIRLVLLIVIRKQIRIIISWIYKYGTISVTIIYINKNDSRINPVNRYKDIC